MKVKDHVMKVFWQDFWEQIDHWIEDGDQLIIGGDWNSNVSTYVFLKDFIKRELIPVNSSRHGNELPPTYNNGSYAIDEVFVTKSLEVKGSGIFNTVPT